MVVKNKYTPQQLEASIAEPNWIVRWETRGKTSTATNPCKTRFSLLQFLKTYPVINILLPAISIIFPVMIVWIRGLDWIIAEFAVPTLWIGGYLWIITQQMQKFACGNLAPGFLIDEHYIVVFTNLSAGGEEDRFAIMRIIAPLDRLAGGPYRVGDRVPVTCLYKAPADKDGAWHDLSPTPVAAGTNDPVALARVTLSIPEEEWALARATIDRFGEVGPGLHKLWVSG